MLFYLLHVFDLGDQQGCMSRDRFLWSRFRLFRAGLILEPSWTRSRSLKLRDRVIFVSKIK